MSWNSYSEHVQNCFMDKLENNTNHISEKNTNDWKKNTAKSSLSNNQLTATFIRKLNGCFL